MDKVLEDVKELSKLVSVNVHLDGSIFIKAEIHNESLGGKFGFNASTTPKFCIELIDELKKALVKVATIKGDLK